MTRKYNTYWDEFAMGSSQQKIKDTVLGQGLYEDTSSDQDQIIGTHAHPRFFLLENAVEDDMTVIFHA